MTRATPTVTPTVRRRRDDTRDDGTMIPRSARRTVFSHARHLRAATSDHRRATSARAVARKPVGTAVVVPRVAVWRARGLVLWAWPARAPCPPTPAIARPAAFRRAAIWPRLPTAPAGVCFLHVFLWGPFVWKFFFFGDLRRATTTNSNRDPHHNRWPEASGMGYGGFESPLGHARAAAARKKRRNWAYFREHPSTTTTKRGRMGHAPERRHAGPGVAPRANATPPSRHKVELRRASISYPATLPS